jgi:hypothetical protein
MLTMVVLFVGCGCVAETRKTYYSYVENLRRDSFLFPPERK